MKKNWPALVSILIPGITLVGPSIVKAQGLNLDSFQQKEINILSPSDLKKLPKEKLLDEIEITEKAVMNLEKQLGLSQRIETTKGFNYFVGNIGEFVSAWYQFIHGYSAAKIIWKNKGVIWNDKGKFLRFWKENAKTAEFKNKKLFWHSMNKFWAWTLAWGFFHLLSRPEIEVIELTPREKEIMEAGLKRYKLHLKLLRDAVIYGDEFDSQNQMELNHGI